MMFILFLVLFFGKVDEFLLWKDITLSKDSIIRMAVSEYLKGNIIHSSGLAV